jgi:hypothetical protein
MGRVTTTPNTKQATKLTKKEQEGGTDHQESALSFDPNIRFGPKLDPTVPLYLLEAIRKV